jgi:hypothetical protein
MVAIMTKKKKDHFLARQWSSFLCFTFFSRSPVQWQKLSFGAYLASPLEHYFTLPLACSLGNLLFCHSFLIVPKAPMSLLGQDLLSQLKTQILLPPRQLSLLPPSSGTNRFHSVDWWDECRASQAGPPYSNKTQKSLTVSTPKTISLQAWGTMRPYDYHKFLRTPRATN